MKKALIVLLSTFFASLALNVQAANVTFDPDMVELSMEPGETARASLTVNGYSDTPFLLFFRLAPTEGNIPAVWLGPAYIRLSSETGGETNSTASLIVQVPSEAMPGSYSAKLMPQSWILAGAIDTPGLFLTIEVTESMSACLGPPAFSDVRITPENIWAPAGDYVEIEISGRVTADDGCGGVAAEYTMESDNGPVPGFIALDEDGNFNETVTILVSKNGSDKSGTVYNGTIIATDAEFNEAELGFSVTVLHDRGKKVGLNK